MNMKINSKALVSATVGMVWFLVGMTLLTELSVSFKAMLVQLSGHHWVGKSLGSVIFFAVVYFVLNKTEEPDDISRGIYTVMGSVFVGGLIIFSFFLFHFLVS